MAQTGHQQSKAFQVVERLPDGGHPEQQIAEVGNRKGVTPVVVGNFAVAFLHHQQKAGQRAAPEPESVDEAEILY
jgi:hypothetical protein